MLRPHPFVVVATLALAGCAREAAPARVPSTATISAADGSRIAGTQQAVGDLLRAEAARLKLPNLAFGVVAGGKLVYAVGIGARDASGGEVTADTVFRIGSVTKTLSGMALLQLRDAGKLDLDDPVAKHLPEVATVRYPTSDSPPITIRHLVTHSSGIPRLGDLRYGDGHEVSRLELRDAIKGVALDFSPGTRSVYSNLAMALSGPIIAKVSGEGYRDYMNRHVLGPLGMGSTVWEPEAVPPGRLAQGYESKDGGFVPCGPHWRLGAIEAMGGLYSSVADLSRYVAFELSAWPPRDGPDDGPLRRSSVRESQMVAGYQRAGREGFGVNWIVKNEPGLGHVVFHNGGTEGYHASIWMLPERGIGVIALGPGTGELDGLSRRALALVASEGRPEPALGAPARAALEVVKKLIAAPERALIERSFAPGFLEHIPADKTLSFFEQVKADAGTCSTERVVKAGAPSPAEAEIELACEGGTRIVKISADPAPPHLIRGLTIERR